MRKFERIRIEKGEAFIRDTGVRVLDIVPFIVSGKTSTALLEQHPTLETEDIIQSLAYSIYDFAEMTGMTRSDGISATSSIINAMSILADEKNALQDSDRQKLSGMIVPAARRALNVWNKLTEWLHIKYMHQLYPSNFTPVELATIIREIEISRTDSGVKEDYYFNTPDKLPPIKSNGYLSIVFTEIFFGEMRHLKPGGQATLEKVAEDKISVEIIKEFKAPLPTPDYFQYLFSFSGYFSTCILIIREHGSEIQITPIDSGLMIAFNLPIWRENT